jgi:hypothetical protein
MSGLLGRDAAVRQGIGQAREAAGDLLGDGVPRLPRPQRLRIGEDVAQKKDVARIG